MVVSNDMSFFHVLLTARSFPRNDSGHCMNSCQILMSSLIFASMRWDSSSSSNRHSRCNTFSMATCCNDGSMSSKGQFRNGCIHSWSEGIVDDDSGMCRHQERNDGPILASSAWVPALQMDSMKLFTFQMSSGDIIADGPMITSHTSVTHSYLQSFDRGQSMRRMMKIFPILSQSFMSQRLKDRAIQCFWRFDESYWDEERFISMGNHCCIPSKWWRRIWVHNEGVDDVLW